jgi:hypothetical protein
MLVKLSWQNWKEIEVKQEKIEERLPDGLKRYTPAVVALQKFLLEREKDRVPGLECSVECWQCMEGGIRISEVGFHLSDGNGCCWGGVWMRCDPESAAVILAAEDFLLTFFDKPYRPKGWESDIDEHADAKWKLESVLKMLDKK